MMLYRVLLVHVALYLVVGAISIGAAGSAAKKFDFLNLVGRSTASASSRSSSLDSCTECNLAVPELIQWHGYPAESHTAETADGYSLGMQRIPYSPRNDSRVDRPVVLLQHGLLDSSFAWVANYPNESLAYILADAGWDVWLGNNRGNYWSPPPTGSNWQFTWDDFAKYDFPAQLDYIMSVTGAQSIGYVGHSQGTTQAFAALSAYPELAAKVNMFAALAPVAYVYHQGSALMTWLADSGLDHFLMKLGVKSFLEYNWIYEMIAEAVCAPNEKTTPYCEDFIFLICGQDPLWSHNLNQTRMEIYMSHTPSGTSVYNMAHWAQSVRNDTFSFFDWGSAEANQQHYNQSTPPVYDLGKIRAPVALFTGSNDLLADPTDVARLKAELNPQWLVLDHNEPDYEHIDFSWGIDCATRIYPLVLDMLIKGHNGVFANGNNLLLP